MGVFSDWSGWRKISFTVDVNKNFKKESSILWKFFRCLGIEKNVLSKLEKEDIAYYDKPGKWKEDVACFYQVHYRVRPGEMGIIEFDYKYKVGRNRGGVGHAIARGSTFTGKWVKGKSNIKCPGITLGEITVLK